MHGNVIGAAQCITMGRICHTAGMGVLAVELRIEMLSSKYSIISESSGLEAGNIKPNLP